MNLSNSLEHRSDRVAALGSMYGAPQACTAHLLCYQHDPASVAYTLVRPDLSSRDLTYETPREESERLVAALRRLASVPVIGLPL